MNTRQIKFRGKRVDNGEWVYGNIQIPKPPFDRYFMWDDDNVQVEVIPETVGQYCGLKDKNNKEIFEGDIVRFWTRSTRNTKYGIKEAVNINNGLLMPFYDPTYTEDEQGDWFDDDKGFEVIGNIYEHKHLLEEKTKTA